MVVNTGLWPTKLLWSLKKTLNHLTLRPPIPTLSRASSQILLQQQRDSRQSHGFWDHEGWQMRQDIASTENTNLTLKTSTRYCLKKKLNPTQMAQLCSERVKGRLTETTYQAYIAQKALIFYRPVCSFPLYLAKQNCSDLLGSHGSSATEGTCL